MISARRQSWGVLFSLVRFPTLAAITGADTTLIVGKLKQRELHFQGEFNVPVLNAASLPLFAFEACAAQTLLLRKKKYRKPNIAA